MKKLSEAWQNRDYYQLLMLKSEIEKNNEVTEIKIDDSQSKSLLKQLDEHIKQLEIEILMFTKHDPDNSFYFDHFNHRSENVLKQKIHKYTNHILGLKKTVSFELESLKFKASTKRFLNDIRDEFEDIDDDFFPFIFE
ncbi:hypothetical protein [Aquimarina agarivorans]|uniref:hypothetical protein n=1 Tax=Aquimarina agarivorans TaxID=980584 RepID=UPI000248E802|nr:hypothetical protein [Aquimarina agarivorans]